MVKIFTAPNCYIQGYGVIEEFGKHTSHLGSKPFIIGGKTALSLIEDVVSDSLAESSMVGEFTIFSGNGTRADAIELAKKAINIGADFIVGTGGGLAIDTVKAVANEANLPLAIMPTIASTNAPCSREAVQYTDDHQFDRVIILKRNPDVIVVDSKIITEAPTRFFVAGMGDALATWIEAQTCLKSGAKNFSGGMPAAAGLAIAKFVYESLLEYGAAAKAAVDQNAASPAVEMIIETNTLLSGIGFENCGIGAVHPISRSLEALEGTENCLHGELVGFSTIVSLILENYPTRKIDEVIGFCKAVGLPISLEQLGIKDSSTANLIKVAKLAFRKGSFIKNLSFEATPQLVVDAILGANARGASFQQRI